MSFDQALNVVLVDDDKDDYLLTQELLEEIDGAKHRLAWVSNYDAGLNSIRSQQHDVCLLDYRLGERSGLELLRQTREEGCRTPIIFLTGRGTGSVEREALAAGAADYLVKGKIDADDLWRALRHAWARNRATEAVRDRDDLFRALFETSLDAMLVTNDEGSVIDANSAASTLFGLPKQKLTDRSLRDLPLVGRDQPELASAALRVVGQHAAEWAFRCPEGRDCVLEVRASANVMPGRNLWTMRDVTERRQTDAVRMRLAALVESAEDGIIGEDLDGLIREWNPAAERQYGIPAAGAIGVSSTRIVPDTHDCEWKNVRARVAAGDKVSNLETVRRRVDGALIDVSLTVSPLRDELGAVVGVTTISRDVSEMKSLRSRLAIADRMASIGTLAAGVAHEINTPLAAVVANLDLARNDLVNLTRASASHDVLQSMTDELRDAADAAGRVRQIVRDLRAFSSPDDERRQPVDVRRAVESTLRMVRNEIRHRARLIEDYGTTPTVDANEGRLSQVILNLLVNAVHALDEDKADQNEIAVATSADGERVHIDISDTGAGIDPEKVGRIFEPFFTTKPVGVGTGLGLSICHGIVRSLGGEISVRSVLGVGTKFRVSLPIGELHRRHASVAPRPLGPEPSRCQVAPVADAGRKRIMFVDDEPMMARVASRILSREFDVECFTDAQEALQRIAMGRRYDVILCDLMMPRMTGMDMFDRLTEMKPDLCRRVVFVTGGAFTQRAIEFLARVSNERLEKPFEASAVLRVARGLAS